MRFGIKSYLETEDITFLIFNIQQYGPNHIEKREVCGILVNENFMKLQTKQRKMAECFKRISLKIK